MFRDVQFGPIFETMARWGLWSFFAVIPFSLLLWIDGFDAFAADVLGVPQHPVTAGKVFIQLMGGAASFLGAVLGFWVGLAREKARAHDSVMMDNPIHDAGTGEAHPPT
jgi:hypothetical protein